MQRAAKKGPAALRAACLTAAERQKLTLCTALLEEVREWFHMYSCGDVDVDDDVAYRMGTVEACFSAHSKIVFYTVWHHAEHWCCVTAFRC